MLMMKFNPFNSWIYSGQTPLLHKTSNLPTLKTGSWKFVSHFHMSQNPNGLLYAGLLGLKDIALYSSLMRDCDKYAQNKSYIKTTIVKPIPVKTYH